MNMNWLVCDILLLDITQSLCFSYSLSQSFNIQGIFMYLLKMCLHFVKFMIQHLEVDNFFNADWIMVVVLLVRPCFNYAYSCVFPISVFKNTCMWDLKNTQRSAFFIF